MKKALFAELMASMREVLAHAKKERRKRKRLASARKDDRRTPDRHPPRTI